MTGIIQIAERRDLAEILSVQKAAFSPIAAMLGKDDLPPLRQTLEDIEADFDKQPFLKYTLDGHIVGSVRIGLDDDGTCWIYKLVVLPEYQSHGIGKALMQAVHERFNDSAVFKLFTGKEVSYIVDFYQRLGYAETYCENNDGVEMVFMERKSG